MAYTDRDMIVATQVAYYDFDADILRSNGYNATLRDLFEQDPGIYQRLENNLAKEGMSDAERYRAEQAIALYHEIMSEDSPYGDWVIKAVKDDNVNSGFYGCLIETSEKDAIIGFRGSESYDGNQKYKDWVKADFGLLNSEETEQQQVAEEFMREISSKYDYENYYTTGHSLGGNLSNHAAITAPKEMKEKIVQSYSFDGPGFSLEYLKEHAKEIKESKGKLTHYGWSLVGGLLYQPPGVRDKTVKIKDIGGWHPLQRHDTSFVEFDENGNVKDGTLDIIRIAASGFSKLVDGGAQILSLFIPPSIKILSDAAEDFFDWLLEKAGVKKEPEKMTGGTQGSGGNKQFQVRMINMSNAFSAMESIGKQLNGIAQEIEQIKGDLKIEGLPAWGIKASLGDQCSNIRSLGDKTQVMKNKGYELLRVYQNTENRIIQNT